MSPGGFRVKNIHAALGNGLTYDRVISTLTSRVKAIQSTSLRAAPVQEQYYLYDALGQVTRRDDDVLGLAEHYTYDALNRLTNWRHDGSGGTGILPVSVAITYDAIGNILRKTDTGDYAYNDPAHPYAVTQISGGPLGTRTHTHDTNGNTLADGPRAYEYTAANKIRRITQGAQTSQFTFDADRQRLTQYREDGTLTTYVGPHYERTAHPSGLIEEKHYIMTPFGHTAVRTVRSDRKIETRYFHQDALGSINVLSDEYGRAETRHAYDPWGKQTTDTVRTDATGKQTRGYTDHEMLSDFGLIHMNARIYDPVTGRFLSADRVVQDTGNSQSYNRYSYCINNPVNATDPTGNEFNFMDFLHSFGSIDWYEPAYEPEPVSTEIINALTGLVSLVLKVAGATTAESQQGKSLLNQGNSSAATASGTTGLSTGDQQADGSNPTLEETTDGKELEITKLKKFYININVAETTPKLATAAMGLLVQLANERRPDSGKLTAAAQYIRRVEAGIISVEIYPKDWGGGETKPMNPNGTVDTKYKYGESAWPRVTFNVIASRDDPYKPLFQLADEITHAYLFTVGKQKQGVFWGEGEAIAVQNELRSIHGSKDGILTGHDNNRRVDGDLRRYIDGKPLMY